MPDGEFLKQRYVAGKGMKNQEEQTGKTAYLFSNRDLAFLILPLLVEQFLVILVGMADTIMIASVGESAVSGVSLVDQVMILWISLFSALATGGAVVVGQYLGQKKVEKAREASWQMVWFGTFCAIGIMLLLYMGKTFVLQVVFGKIQADVRNHADIYFMIVTASIPFVAIYNLTAAIFRTMGDSRTPMQVSVLMNLINVAGNAALIYGAHLGTPGVAIPTLTSQVIAALILLLLLFNKKRELYLKATWRYRPDWSMIGRILSIGIPNGLENSMFQLGKVLVLSLISTFGTYAIAANAVSNAVALFQILPGMAMTLAVTPVIARCVGAGDYRQVTYYNKKFLILTHISMAVVVGGLFLIRPQILEAYHLSARTAEVTGRILTFHGICAVLIWPASFTLPCTFRATGDAKVCMYISIFSMWIFRIAFSYILGSYFHMGVFGVWVAMVIDWVFRTSCFLLRYRSGKWKKEALV